MASVPFPSFKINQLYLCIFIATCASCNQTPSFKDYGVISSETDSIPTIDTSNNDIRPVTLVGRLYHLTNKSTDHSINFVCKAYLKGDDDVISEKTEKHTLAPQEIINLEIDSNNNQKVIRYEIFNATTVNK